MRRPDPDRLGRTAALLAAAFAVLYAVTWNGRYLHDGPAFLQAVADGEWLHVHAAYLPTAQILLAAFGWIPGVDGSLCLAAMAVGSGAACVGFTALLVGRAVSDVRAAAVTACLVGLAPVVWAASGMVEIHVFGGAGACAGAWIAYRLQRPPWQRLLLAVPVAMTAHMTNVLLVPLFVALSLEPSPVRRDRRAVLAALAAAAVSVLGLHLVGRSLPPKVEALGGALPVLAGRALQLAGHPRELWHRTYDEFVLPWLLLSLGPLLAFAPFAGGPGRWTRIAAACTGAFGAVLVATYMPLAGQYGLVLCPALALGVGRGVAAWMRFTGGPWIAAGALALTLALAPFQRARLAEDPDRSWAVAIAARLQPDDTVLCLGRARQWRVQEYTRAQAINFQAAGDAGASDVDEAIAGAVATADAAGRTLYLDPQILERGPHVPPLAPIVAAIRRELRLHALEGIPLVRVEEKPAR